MIKLSIKQIKKLCDKFAKLTDEQYKYIVRNPRLLWQLSEDNLIDDFYKASPDMSESDMLDHLRKTMDDRRKVQNNYRFEKLNKIDKDNVIVKFLQKHGEETIGIPKEVFTDELNMISQQVFSITGKYLIESYNNGTVGNLLEQYLNIPSALNVSNIITFIQTYNDWKSFQSNLEDENAIIALKEFVKSFIKIVSLIYAHSENMQGNIDVYDEALEIRESDKFDYLVNSQYYDASKVKTPTPSASAPSASAPVSAPSNVPTSKRVSPSTTEDLLKQLQQSYEDYNDLSKTKKPLPSTQSPPSTSSVDGNKVDRETIPPPPPSYS